jgi:hypothetical protein
MGSGDVAACILNFASVKVSVQLHAVDAVTLRTGLVGLRVSLHFLKKRRIHYLCLEFNSISLVIQPIA